MKKQFISNKKSFDKSILYTFITAFCVLSICSLSSPLYKFNDWVDANAFMTVGKSMLHGIVPYRDLFEHKGPVLYMLHAFASIFSSTSFIGVWMLEIIFATAFLYICNKFSKLYIDHKYTYIYIPIIAFIVYSAPNTVKGDSVEEFCLPFFAYAIYVGIKAIKNNEFLSKKECFIVGLTSGAVLWMKYTLLGFYIGYFVFFVIYAVYNKDLKGLINNLLFISLGVLVITAPVLIYFALNGAVKDLFEIYFYDNMFLYASKNTDSNKLFTLAVRFFRGLKSIISTNIILILCIAAGIINYITKKNYLHFCFMAITGVFTFIFVYIGGSNHIYYSLIFSVHVVIAIPIIDNIIRKIKFKRNYSVVAATTIFIICCALSYVRWPNTFYMNYSAIDYPQYRFAKIINNKPNSTLLNYNFLDGGFYTVAGKTPNCKYFYKSNLMNSEIEKFQHDYIVNKKTDFIVTNKEFDIDGYELIDQHSYYRSKGHTISTYYLYQLK